MKYKEKMPRKMKKRFKKLMKFYDERKKEYEKEKQNQTQTQTVGTLLGFLLIEKIIDMGIAPESVSDIKVERRENDIQATVKLHGAMESAEITVNMEG